MEEISCYYYHANYFPRHIVFIKYENYFKIYLSTYRWIILSKNTFMKIPNLFEYYLLSLLTTENIDEIKNNKIILKVEFNWKGLYFTDYYDDVEIKINKNSIRETSDKKIKKFIKNFKKNFNSPLFEISKLILSRTKKEEIEIDRYNKYNKKIRTLIYLKKKFDDDIAEIIFNYL